MAEEARLESVYTSKAYPGFESPSLRQGFGDVYELVPTHFTLPETNKIK